MAVCLLWATATLALAQSAGVPQSVTATEDSQVSTLTARSTLVLVPALVRNKARELVFTLKAEDFVLTDDGVRQTLKLEQDTGGEPLALVVVVEGGGAAEDQLGKFGALSSMLGAVVGDVPHKIAVVGFDSSPVLVQDFTPDTVVAAHGIQTLVDDDSGDKGAAILDSLGMAVEMLRKQPPGYRRAILLVSETNDHGSKMKLNEALRELSDTNTVIYSLGFSSGRDELKNESAKALGSSTPGPAKGCMSRDPNDPNVDLTKSAAAQAYGCLTLLAPPIALAKAAAVAFIEALQKNIPETVARLSGGEYFKLGNEKGLERSLQTISNHLPNRYVLSFQPESPHVGFHSIRLAVPGYEGMNVSARNGYWADGEAASPVAPPSHP
ncbi:MAG: VWA domain-containing protein [Acidobacteriaceae bacterium]|nr:VWA domain-containing protein [Acidobacteriaceae bacterium]